MSPQSTEQGLIQLSYHLTFGRDEYKFSKAKAEEYKDKSSKLLNEVLKKAPKKLSGEHLKFLAYILDESSNSRTYFSSTQKNQIFALILTNYTISNKEKKRLWSSFKFKVNIQLKSVLNVVLNNPQLLLSHRIKRSALEMIVGSYHPKHNQTVGFSLDYYLQNQISCFSRSHFGFDMFPRLAEQEKPVEPARSHVDANVLKLYCFLKKSDPNLETSISHRYTFYLHEYHKDWVRNLMEKHGIVKASSFLCDYNPIDKKEPQNKYNLWMSSFKGLFSKKNDFAGYSLFCKKHEEFILAQFKKNHQLLETMEGFKDPRKALEFMDARKSSNFFWDRDFEIPFTSPIKEGLSAIFGFHSPKLVNFLNQKSLELSSESFIHKLQQGRVVRDYVSAEATDLRWAWLKLDIPRNSFPLFLARYKEKILKIYSEDQFYKVWEASLKGDNTYNVFMEAQDAISMSGEMLPYLKTLSFNEINTWHKLHEVTSREYTRLKNPLKKLELEGKYPSITKLKNLDLGNGCKLIVPDSNHDLVFWGQSLRICVGSYADRVRVGSCLVLGVEKEGSVQFCVEFARRQTRSNSYSMEVIQFKGHSNKNGPEDLLKTIQEKVVETLSEEFTAYQVTEKTRNGIFIFDEVFLDFEHRGVEHRVIRERINLPLINAVDDNNDD